MKTTGKRIHAKPAFDADGYQTGMNTLNNEALPALDGASWRPLHGGARPGAGRKPSKREPITLRLRPVVARKLRAAAKREKVSTSDFAERWLVDV
ncbi:hypothetical protein [Ereboglobus luteus]|uniref:Ribbon-helix-helix protein CopG domain-containing protein n=1 Tax=Ereboglobus luteus TaxID=1796921 RepID=A0A2U8E2V7_9BACT|nr:hypothetical protein [Ereboglobus luteus]AWI08862.1 hypothetical protein CKA38_05990 [Ereboglobus luteus]